MDVFVVKSRERDIRDYGEWASSSLMLQRVECVGQKFETLFESLYSEAIVRFKIL